MPLRLWLEERRGVVKSRNAKLVDLWLAKKGLIDWQNSKYEKIRAERCRMD